MLRLIMIVLKNLFRAPFFVKKMRRMGSNKEKYSEEIRYAYARSALGGWIRKSGKIETLVYGKENLPKEGGYVMYPNHQGKYDVLGIVYAHERPCTFVMDKAKSYTFIVREIVDMIGAKRIELHSVRNGLKVMNEITEEVKLGKRFILFSEGGYKKNKNHVQEFKPGSFKCAMNAKCPVVPVALIDSYKPFGSPGIGRVYTKVVFLPPINYEEYKGMKSVELSNLVKERIIEKMEEFGVDAR